MFIVSSLSVCVLSTCFCLFWPCLLPFCLSLPVIPLPMLLVKQQQQNNRIKLCCKPKPKPRKLEYEYKKYVCDGQCDREDPPECMEDKIIKGHEVPDYFPFNCSPEERYRVAWTDSKVLVQKTKPRKHRNVPF